MPPPKNRYLVTRGGSFVGTRAAASLAIFGPLVGPPALGAVGACVGSALDAPPLVALSIAVAVVGLAVGVALQGVFLLRGGKDVERAIHALRAGDTHTAVALCQAPLARVFRADVRTRALFVLGLAAESNADFVEAADLFERASAMIPALAASHWQRHARVIVLCHRAIALVATRRLDEADLAVRQAAQLFPQRPGGFMDAITDDVAFGPLGVAAALRDLEPGRDPRALLSLATVVVLAARGMGREAVEIIERERYSLERGLAAREHALLARAESRGRAALGGGALRSPAMIARSGADASSEAWAERVLPAGS